MEKLTINKTEWGLNSLVDKDKSFEEKRKEWQEKTQNFISKWKNRKDYLQEPGVLREALDDYEEWKRFYGVEADEIYYFWLKTQQDQNNSEIKGRFNDVESFSKKIENDMKFFTLKIAKIPEGKQKKFLEYSKLGKYKHFLERLFIESKYLLSEKEEKIMNLKSSSSYSSWIKMTSGFLSKEEKDVLDEENNKVVKNFSELLSLMNNPNKEVRDKAAEAFNDILKKFNEVAEAEMNAILADKKVDDELRSMKRPDFSRHLEDDIDSEVVDILVKAVSKRFDISKKY